MSRSTYRRNPMSGKTQDYQKQLKELHDWRPFLLQNSGLPGPRGNLELAEAVAELASESQVETLLAIPLKEAAENSPNVFLVFSGITALGKMIGRGRHANFRRLRSYASDRRWRIREAVAIALQYAGDANMLLLLDEMKDWITGSWYEKRAAAAALAEPRLLKEPAVALQVLKVLDQITKDMASAPDVREESFRILRQTMGYCWSVAAAARPKEGKVMLGKWLRSRDPDVRWIMKENLRKSRLSKMDASWVKASLKKLEDGA